MINFYLPTIREYNRQIMITVIGTPLIRCQIRDVALQNAKTQSHLVEVLTRRMITKAIERARG